MPKKHLVAIKALSPQEPQLSIPYRGNPPFVEIKAPINGYDTHAKWPVKVKYCLKQLRTGYVTDIVDKIMKYEPNLSRDKVLAAVTYNASLLYRDGVIDAKKEGYKNLYIAK